MFGGESEWHVRDMLRDGAHDGGSEARDEAVEWLKKYLADSGGEAMASDVIETADRIGIRKTTLTRARQRAGVTSSKDGFGGGWIWRLTSTEGTKRRSGE